MVARWGIDDDMNFEDVFAKYQKLIYNLSRRIMGNDEDAQDITQEVAIKVYRNLHKCKGEDFVAAWISKITHNTCMDALRKRKGKFTSSLDDTVGFDDGEVQVQIEDEAIGPEALLLQKELNAQIETALLKLSTEYRTIVILRDVNGYSYEEIAEITGLPEGTVKSRLFRGRSKLKNILLREQNQSDLR
ncbi:MAG: sigma-70 family RNA polymerase sigma factor [Defluviitaleaceae bacterium]|nr:sigma-70 family RNA polymerase sigma factor [Defluviitaleaceae bacterium]